MGKHSTLKKPGSSFVSASELARIHVCPHFWYNQCFADSSKVVPPDEGSKRRIQRGIEFEKEVVSTLKVVTPNYDPNAPWSGTEPTIALMRIESPLIYHGVLKNDRLFGIPDLLELVPTKSELGGFSYQPIDIKSHIEVTKKDKLQLAAYSIMLEKSQGTIPSRGGIILGDKTRVDVSLETEIKEIQNVKKTATLVERQKLKTDPLRCLECETCHWSEYCDSERRVSHSVTLLHGIKSKETKSLISNGFATFDVLADAKETSVAKLTGIKLDRCKELKIIARAWAQRKPIQIQPIDLPSSDTVVIHYDIETYGDKLYLHGLIVLENGKRHLRQFMADSPEHELELLTSFLEYLAQWEKPIIYTWTKFENGWMEKMQKRYSHLTQQLSLVLKSFKDLKEVVKLSMALPVTTFSIKEVAPVFGFNWRAEDAGGGNSEVWYADWLKTGNRDLRRKLLDYNEDDIKAMEIIYEALRKNTGNI